MGLLDESILNFRLLPNDIDVSKMTNDRYLAFMDLGRIDLVLRLGLFKIIFKNNWQPVISFATIRFRHPIRLFQRFQLKSKIIWWDDKSVYIEQVFVRQGRVQATGYVLGTLLGKNGAIPPGEILDKLGDDSLKPQEPELAAKLREMESHIHEVQKEPTPL